MKKKSLLLCSVVLVAFGANAQTLNKTRVEKLDIRNVKRSMIEKSIIEKSVNRTVDASGTSTQNSTANKTNALNKVKIGSSVNFFTLLISGSNAIDVKPDLNAISFTHRQTAVAPESGNNVRASVSKDGGASFVKIAPVYSGTAAVAGRYPQGAIIPKPGSVSTAEAMIAVSGPITDGSAWVSNYFASAMLDGTSANQIVLKNGDPGVVFQQMARHGMNSTSDGKVYNLGLDIDYNATDIDPTFKGAVVNTGVADFAAKKINWTSKQIPYVFVKDANAANVVTDYGQVVMSYKTPGLGYVVAIGGDPSQTKEVYYPILFKTTDGGATWNKLPFVDFETIPGIAGKFDPAFASPLLSYNQSMDLVIDDNNNLHIFTSANPYDVASGQYQPNMTALYDFIYSSAGSWKAVKIANLSAKIAPAGTLEFFTDLSQDSRPQVMTVDTEPSRIIYAWEDTQTDTANIYPDIYLASYETTSSVDSVPASAVKNITKNTNYEANNFWLYAGNVAQKSGTKYKVHLTTSEQNDPNLTTGGDPSDHYYMNGAEYSLTNSIFDAVKPTFSVSQNVPNPFSTSTTISIKADKPGMATLSITNILGQKVSEQSAFVSTVHKFTVAKAGLEKGIYFYTVSQNGGELTKKMIVE